MLNVLHEAAEATVDGAEDGRLLLDGIVREGARQVPAAVSQAEVTAYVGAHAD